MACRRKPRSWIKCIPIHIQNTLNIFLSCEGQGNLFVTAAFPHKFPQAQFCGARGNLKWDPDRWQSGPRFPVYVGQQAASGGGNLSRAGRVRRLAACRVLICFLLRQSFRRYILLTLLEGIGRGTSGNGVRISLGSGVKLYKEAMERRPWRLVVITGFQRSGTTALGEMLGNSRKAAYFGEIFHPDGYADGERAEKLRLRPAANFFRFFDQELEASLRVGPPTLELQRMRWNAYLQHLERLEAPRRPIIDIKYNSWWSLSVAWQDPDAPPCLFSLVFDNSQAAAIHIVRRNLLDQALSEAVAHATDLWHNYGTTSVPLRAVSIEPVGILARMRASIAQTKIVSQFLADRPHIILAYEEAFAADGTLSLYAKGLLSELTGEACLGELQPVLRKLSRNPRDQVLNFDEILDFVAQSEFSELAIEKKARSMTG